MRVLLLAAACLLAGCVLPSDPAPAEAAPPALDVLGGVRVVGADLLPATYGEGTPVAPLRVLVAGEEAARAGEGSGVALALDQGGARLRLMNHAEWVRTSLRWEDPSCVVTLRAAGVESTLPGGRLTLDNALGPEYPYHEYAFSGSCSGRLFVLWRG